MKTPAHIIGLLAVLTVSAHAETTPPPPAAEVTPPAVPEAAVTVAAAPTGTGVFTTEPSPEVLELPKMVVKQKPRPRLTPEAMMTTKGFGEELAKQKFSSFDRNFLNKFTLPLFGISAEERALEEHRREKNQELYLDVLNINKALNVIDPGEAKSLQAAAPKP